MKRWHKIGFAVIAFAMIASSCISPPFNGGFTVGHDKNRHGWPAVDFRIPQNTPLRAVADGTITMVGYEAPGSGDPSYCPKPTAFFSDGAVCGTPHKFVVLRLAVEDNGCRRIAYKHLNGYRVRVGQQVTRGQIVGRSGNDIVRNPHLHFDCQPDNDARFNFKPTGLDYPIISWCDENGRWRIGGSDTFKRGDRINFNNC